MAVSGSDWRKSADGYWTDTTLGVVSVRPDRGGASAVSDPRTGGRRSDVDRTLADDTDRNTNGTGFDPVETDGSVSPRPLAIGAPGEDAPITEHPDDEPTKDVDIDTSGDPAGPDLDEAELSLRYLHARSGYSMERGDRRPIHEKAPGANGSCGRTTDQTVIIK
ncbi:hypothetical protein KM295_06635 [Natronomonas sp. F2-12]|jgi:hypothetical protein|uniref:Uncharacterized protein n=1 Tax=Natronomonas aquatica TaxID=2841590 RepID=A0A9R1CT14_9EURY|nr:hypothetical protein [Natronomonas aquatica]MCQ4333159.1 hypothetical protein [Natronomonas aquatica]